MAYKGEQPTSVCCPSVSAESWKLTPSTSKLNILRSSQGSANSFVPTQKIEDMTEQQWRGRGRSHDRAKLNTQKMVTKPWLGISEGMILGSEKTLAMGRAGWDYWWVPAFYSLPTSHGKNDWLILLILHTVTMKGITYFRRATGCFITKNYTPRFWNSSAHLYCDTLKLLSYFENLF